MGSEQDRTGGRPPASRLVEAVRQVKIAAADKSDVVVEMREADRARLELLAQELASVIEEVPVEDERFDFAISAGLQPRFWIDATAHVMMGPDRRTYRFVRDTRLGRVLLGESTDKAKIADKVTTYIATRLHERELVLAGETLSVREIVSGRAPDADADSAPAHDPSQRKTTILAERIDQAAEALKGQDKETAAKPAEQRKPAQAHSSATGMKRISPDDAAAQAPKAPPRRVQNFVGGVMWVLFGAAIGAALLAWLFRGALV